MVHLRFHPVSMILHRTLVHRGTLKKLKVHHPDNNNKQQQINNNKFYRQSNSAPDNRAVVVDAAPVADAVLVVDAVPVVEVVEGNEFAQRFVVRLFSGITNPITLIRRTNQH